MSSLETPENSGNPGSCPEGGFAALLDWHRNSGTRPNGDPGRLGKRWSNGEFAGRVGGVTERTVRNWRAGRSRPYDLPSIERELFGDTAAYDTEGEAPPAASAPERVTVPPPHFLGRDAAIAELLPLLDTAAGAAVLLQGGPGRRLAFRAGAARGRAGPAGPRQPGDAVGAASGAPRGRGEPARAQ